MQNKDVWGFWGTTVWFVVVACVFLIIQSIVFGVYVGIAQAANGVTPDIAAYEALVVEFQYNGNIVALSTIVSGVVCTLLTLLAIKLNKGLPIRTYLGFIGVEKAVFIKWLVLFTAVLVLSELFTIFIGEDPIPESMREMYETASPVWLLWLAVILVAPVFEEVFFRGFLFEGLSRSVLGPYAAIVVTAAIWAAIHLQYELYHIALIFIWGLIFGVCKLKTGSLYVPIGMHVLANSIATAQFYL